MKFKHLHVQNFQSLGDLSFNFPSGLTLIDGFNLDTNSHIGAGKSALINALVFSLYGRIPKDVVLSDLIKDGEAKLHTHLELEVNDKKIEIGRTRTPKSTKIELKVNDKVVDGLAKDIDNQILNIIGLTFEQFLQIIYVYQNSANRFISLNDTDKKNFLSTLFNLEMYDEAYKQAHTDLNKIELELSSATGQLESLKDEQIRLVEQKDEAVKKYDTISREQNQQKTVLLQQAEGLKVQLDDLNRQKVASENRSDIQELEGKKNVLSYALIEIEGYKQKVDKIERNCLTNNYSIDGIDKAIKDFDGSVNCPTCQRPWPPEYRDNTESLIKSYKAQRSLLVDENKQDRLKISELNNKIVSETQLRSQYEQLSNEIARLKSTGIDSILLQIKLKKTELKAVIDQYESCDKEKQFRESAIQQLDELIQRGTARLQSVVDNQAQLTEAKKYLLEIKKIFSPTGIKAYIFNGIIGQLNQSIEQYLNRLTNGDILFKIVLDESKVKYIDILECQGKSRSVASLSGGEHRKLSLAVDLALSDVVCSRVNYVPNILFLDESFNGLDAGSKEVIMGVLIEISKSKSVMVVDHSTEFKSLFTQTIKLIKENGTTRQELE